MSRSTRERTPIEAALGYRFKDEALLRQALTHRSMVAFEPEAPSNEPLEFLGDAVLSFVVAETLHRRDPLGAEGPKTRMRARLVSTPTLVAVGQAIGVGSAVRMSPAEEKNRGREQEKVQEDAVEALIAAVYLDGGIEAARGVVNHLFASRLDEASIDSKDAKGALQEFLQARGQELPAYEVETIEGPTHRQVHRARCLVDGEVLGRGEGSTRKKAELIAAAQALDLLVRRSS